jgi:hypothetical protein
VKKLATTIPLLPFHSDIRCQCSPTLLILLRKVFFFRRFTRICLLHLLFFFNQRCEVTCRGEKLSNVVATAWETTSHKACTVAAGGRRLQCCASQDSESQDVSPVAAQNLVWGEVQEEWARSCVPE